VFLFFGALHQHTGLPPPEVPFWCAQWSVRSPRCPLSWLFCRCPSAAWLSPPVISTFFRWSSTHDVVPFCVSYRVTLLYLFVFWEQPPRLSYCVKRYKNGQPFFSLSDVRKGLFCALSFAPPRVGPGLPLPISFPQVSGIPMASTTSPQTSFCFPTADTHWGLIYLGLEFYSPFASPFSPTRPVSRVRVFLILFYVTFSHFNRNWQSLHPSSLSNRHPLLRFLFSARLFPLMGQSAPEFVTQTRFPLSSPIA